MIPISQPIKAPEALIQIVKGAIFIPIFPDFSKNLEETVTKPEKIRIASEKAEQERVALEAQLYVKPAYVAPVEVKDGELTGDHGYAIGGNCVNEITNRPMGNPITWVATTQTPYIGAAALFYYNHVARIVGFWSNGDIEVAQQGWSGTPITRFPRSTFRGFL